MLKKLTSRTALAITAAGVLAHTALAGTAVVDAKKEVIAVEPEQPAFSGWMSFDINSHFISYGADVWGAGTQWDKGVFNPSMELAWKTPIPNLSLLIGTWWDVNNNTVSSIGGMIQEIDVWFGANYTWNDLSATFLYQAWNYGGQTEQILDFTLKYNNNMFLNPAVTMHNRVDPGAAEGGGGQNGIFVVPNISYNIPVWKFTFTPSLAVGFATKHFHGGGGGYGYLALGINGSVPIPYLPGNWELHGGITYYNTNDYVIPSNVADNFVTGNIGIKLSF
jgi:hypothetical protein